jgi:hypothetical protein
LIFFSDLMQTNKQREASNNFPQCLVMPTRWPLSKNRVFFVRLDLFNHIMRLPRKGETKLTESSILFV